MDGLLTGLVLGAGASYCYEDGSGNIPTQADIVGRLFYGADASGDGFPSFVGPAGLSHSFGLGQALRRKHEIPECTEPNSKLDFWTRLQERGLDLESLYAELEADPVFSESGLLREFEAIVRTAVLNPPGERSAEEVCRYHRLLVQSLEPGDYIVSFNWDPLMADALLHYSHFWYPATGFGIPMTSTMVSDRQKSLPIQSLVHLFQVHGSVVLFEAEKRPHERLLYVGPRQWSPVTGLFAAGGGDPSRISEGTQADWNRVYQDLDPDSEQRVALGLIRLADTWFRPLFTPPSRYKKELGHWYAQWIRRLVHRKLPITNRLVLAGYSCPEADEGHLRALFVRGVLPDDREIEVVNPENESPAFRDRVGGIFPGLQLTWKDSDFREYCARIGEQPSTRNGPTGPPKGATE